MSRSPLSSQPEEPDYRPPPGSPIPGSKYLVDYCFICKQQIRVIVPRVGLSMAFNLCNKCTGSQSREGAIGPGSDNI